MIREVRILEDKLYEADYKNRVLAEKLKRARIEASEVPIHSAKPARRPDIMRNVRPQEEPSFETKPNSNPAGTNDSEPTVPAEDDEVGLSDLLPPTFDEGERVDPDTLDIDNSTRPADPKKPLNFDRVPLTDPPASSPPNVLPAPAFPDSTSPKDLPPFSLSPSPGSTKNDGSTTPSELNTGTPLLDPAPGGPVPPGKEDTELPPVLPGEKLPPQFGSPDENKPPGQIKLPDSIKSNERVPDALQIHPTLSGASRMDGKIQDMLLVVNVVNDLGKTIRLDDFLVDGEMSVVVLDPQREPSMARLGRWNFDREQVLSFVKASPVSGFHIPLDWTMDEPLGSEVIVHVRLRAEDDEMRCEATLNLDKQRGVAGWLPRPESFR